MRDIEFIDYPYRWFRRGLVLAFIPQLLHVLFVVAYAGVHGCRPSQLKSRPSDGFAALAYLAWFVVGYVSISSI